MALPPLSTTHVTGDVVLAADVDDAASAINTLYATYVAGSYPIQPAATYIRGDGTIAKIGPTYYNAESYGFTRGADNATQLATVQTAMSSVPGILYLPGGAWPYSTAAGFVVSKTGCGILGDGNSTVLMPTNNVAAHAISVHQSTGGTNPNATMLMLRDFQLDCINMPTGAFNGIFLTSTPNLGFATGDYRSRYPGTTTALSGTGSVQTYTLPTVIGQSQVNVGDTVIITGAVPTGFNGTFTVTADAVAGTSSTFTVAGSAVGPQTAAGFVQIGGGLDGGGLDADIRHILSNVTVKNAPQDCFSGGSEGGHCWFRCTAFQSQRYGFNLTTDTQLVACQSSSAGTVGFNVGAPAVILTACKSYYSGWVTASLGNGFYINSNGFSGGVSLVGCEAQDNRLHGFALNGSENVSLIGCTADSNSGTFNNYIAGGVGVDLFNSFNNNIEVICMDRNDGGFGARQRYATQVRSSSTGNRIRVTHTSTGSGANFHGAIMNWDSTSTGNDVSINGSAGQQYIAYAATITPDPTNGHSIIVGTLTAAITIAAPAHSSGTGLTYWPGMVLQFTLTQDATGGRAITWNAIYHLNSTSGGLPTTLSKTNIITFEYDIVAGYFREIDRATGF